MDLLNTSTIPLTLTVTLDYQSFHTVNPNAVYPGGIPIELPLAELSLDSCLVEQTQSTTGTWISIGDDTFSLDAIVPVLVSMEATFEGQPLPLASGSGCPSNVASMLTRTGTIASRENVSSPMDIHVPVVLCVCSTRQESRESSASGSSIGMPPGYTAFGLTV